MGELMVLPARRLAAGRVPALVPVPLTKARRRERGFNQAELLARSLSRRTGWPLAHLLSRDRGGPALARLGRQERARATESAYSIRPDATESLLVLEDVMIVDDVITTGATGVACADALSAAGAECLGIVSFARTDPLAEDG